MPNIGPTDAMENNDLYHVFLTVIKSIHPKSRQMVYKWFDLELVMATTDESVSLQSVASAGEVSMGKALKPPDCHMQND